MPTDNRRVATYLPKELDDRFKAFITERGFKGDSSALIVILSEYFGVSYQVSSPTSQSDKFVTREEFETLTVKVDELTGLDRSSDLRSELLSELLEKIESLESRLTVIESTRNKISTSKEETLSTGELAKRLNMNGSTLSHWKSSDPKKGKSPDELLKATRAKDPDGIGWILVPETSRFKPERNLPGSSTSKPQGELLPFEVI